MTQDKNRRVAILLLALGLAGLSVVSQHASEATDSKTRNASTKKSCLQLGESDYHAGVPMGGDPVKPCCPGLTEAQDLFHAHYDPKNGCLAAAGDYGHACIACGDGKCDKRYENECNCPQDCKPSSNKQRH